MSHAQISVDFGANETSGCGSLQVSFTDQSSSTAGAINSWAWELGGVTSSNQNPGRIFGLPGQYTICLTVTDVAGNSGSACKTNFIQVFDLPQPAFDVSTADGCVPSTITFTDLSTSADGTITDWVWGVGGEKGVVSSSGSQAPFDNTYSLADSYTISLTVFDDNNCVNTITEEDFITIHPDPVLDLSADQTFGCEAPFTINFTNQSPDLSINYTWIFSNGFEFFGATPPPITFAETGLYDVTLIGSSGQTGCADTLFLEDYIQIGYPIDFGYTPENGCFNLEVAFTDFSPDPASTVTWDFGDGNSSMEANPVHIYTDPGCYTVVLSRLVDGCVGISVSETCVEVYSRPTGSITQDNRLGCTAPHLVNFTSTTTDAVSWAWDFGDGQTSDLPNPSHTYDSNGTFPVSLLITNADGCPTRILGDTIEVVPLVARFIDNEEQGCTPLTFSLEENSQTVSPINGWEWIVSSNASSPAIEFISTDQSPTFTLVDTGFYDLACTVREDYVVYCKLTEPTYSNLSKCFRRLHYNRCSKFNFF
ncbi:MAG: PKD domain-containing protein [Bacteroidota bacterium]